MSKRFRIGRPTHSDRIVDLDATKMSATIQITGRAYVDPANDLYDNIQTTRFNRSRFVRIVGYTSGVIAFKVQGIVGGSANVGVVVNNTPFANVPIDVSTVVPRWYAVAGMPVGSKTVDIYEEFQDRTSNINAGIDGRVSACYIQQVALPQGSGGRVHKVRADVAIAFFGDSHMDGSPPPPISVNGCEGQLRRAALAAGWTAGYAGSGSSTLCADGPDALQTAALVHDLWDDCGATTKILFGKRRPNDYAYYLTAGPAAITPTDYGNFLIAMWAALDVSDPGWIGHYSRIPQGPGWGPNVGGFTRQDYWNSTVAASTAGGRTNVTTHDETEYATLNLATDYVEAPPLQVHPNQTGNDKEFATERVWFGL